ncbi:MAG TPA: SAM-dependent methyltransferase [Motilibacteraceae bacterium]|nr:SAM-dependent methyltransferase [Motilibacteraceae bacterium]
MTSPTWPTSPTWREAVQRALYGPDGFYRRPEGPAGHFRTSVHAAPDLLAGALVRLARAAGLTGVVDVGAGRGELLAAVHAADPDLSLLGVDVVPRPSGLVPAAGWAQELPERLPGVLVVANEWLDDVPCDVVVRTADGWRVELVDPSTGATRVGPPPAREDAGWLERWWPAASADVGDRAEVGRSRDLAWAGVVSRLDGSAAVAVDYAHSRAERVAGRWPAGTLVGYVDGRSVEPVPDGRCDVTAHVALDSCAEAGEAAGAGWTLLTVQRTALRALGVAGERPPPELARTEPRAYLAALSRAGAAAELTDPAGLGAFGWLVQGVGVAAPGLLAATV